MALSNSLSWHHIVYDFLNYKELAGAIQNANVMCMTSSRCRVFVLGRCWFCFPRKVTNAVQVVHNPKHKSSSVILGWVCSKGKHIQVLHSIMSRSVSNVVTRLLNSATRNWTLVNTEHNHGGRRSRTTSGRLRGNGQERWKRDSTTLPAVPQQVADINKAPCCDTSSDILNLYNLTPHTPAVLSAKVSFCSTF